MPLPKPAVTIPLALVTIVAAVFAAYTWVALTWNYSEGERAGFMQKLSKKGWLCKTWEGELSLVALPGAAAEKINKLVGQRVALVYAEHKGVPTSCFGDTPYFVSDVKAVQPNL